VVTQCSPSWNIWPIRPQIAVEPIERQMVATRRDAAADAGDKRRTHEAKHITIRPVIMLGEDARRPEE
jgi:hypothetical protein